MLMPRMGESIMEGTILKWLKKEGDQIEQDDSVLEVATDKVDTEVPATQSGILKKILVQEGEVAEVGKPIAIIEQQNGQNDTEEKVQNSTIDETKTIVEKKPAETSQADYRPVEKKQGGRFYSPLVKNIARKEGISEAELDKIEGSGKEGRVTKKDILDYVNTPKSATGTVSTQPRSGTTIVDSSPGDEIIQMDRMRKMISQRMLESKQISAHVTSFVEADVTNLVSWRNKVKDAFLKREGEPFTYTPLFIEAIAQAIRDYPMINVSVNGDQIIKRKNVNVGMAVALPNGNLIVPVIRNADQLSLIGLSKKVNELAEKARNNKLTADELSEGTYTVSNIGSFGNIMGTPIIMQPQVAILAIGSIVKKPSVIETPSGDAIGIRSKMYLSHSYDHRVVDGALGGLFVKRVADLLESFDINRVV